MKIQDALDLHLKEEASRIIGQHLPGRGDGHWNGKATHENQQKKKMEHEALVPLNTALG